jgi:hypothetical protein
MKDAPTFNVRFGSNADSDPLSASAKAFNTG